VNEFHSPVILIRGAGTGGAKDPLLTKIALFDALHLPLSFRSGALDLNITGY